MLWNSNGVTHLTLIEDAANKYRYMFKRTMAISHTSSELCLTVSHVERGVSFFSRVQGERNIEILNFYLRSLIARYNSDPVKTCLSNWYIFYYATRKMKTSISPNKKKMAWISWKLFGHFHLRFWKPCTCTYVYILFRCSYFFITFLHNMNTVWSGFSKFALYKVKNIHTYNV